VLAATAAVLAIRLAAGGDRTVARALAEAVLWLAVLAVATRRLERGLLGELRGYLRRPEPSGVAAAG
jgi:hypothetical protein